MRQNRIAIALIALSTGIGIGQGPNAYSDEIDCDRRIREEALRIAKMVFPGQVEPSYDIKEAGIPINTASFKQVRFMHVVTCKRNVCLDLSDDCQSRGPVDFVATVMADAQCRILDRSGISMVPVRE